MMIEAIIADHLGCQVRGFRVLDIGCGNGGISEYFAAHNEVHAVDVSDRRRDKSADYVFSLVDSVRLPFDQGQFDLVLSHHVIEHVDDQGLHLDEMHRILRPDGACYLGTPNRTSPLMKGHVGNEHVLHYGQMAPLFEAHGFCVHEYGLKVVTHPRKFCHEMQSTRFVPTIIARRLRPWYPSHMFVLTPRQSGR